MNIVIVSTAFPWRGGIAHYVALLYRQLVRRHKVNIVTFKRQYPAFLFPGKTQEETGGGDSVRVPAEQIIDSMNPFTWAAAARRISALQPDVLVFKYWLPFFGPCFGYIARKVKRLTSGRSRSVFILDNIVPHERRMFDKAFTNYALRSADACIVQSKSVEQELKQRFPRIPYRFVAHPVYELFGNAIGKREARNIIGVREPRVMLFFGYVRPYKGLQVLLRAMPEIVKSAQVKLVVVGEFYGDESDYRKLIKELKLEQHVVVRAEYMAAEKVGPYFSACDLVVLPYVSATQSGIVQIAYQFDKPVVATNVGGLSEVVIDNRTGYIVPPNDPAALARAVVRYYREHKEGDFVRGIHEEKRKYTWDNLVKAIEALAAQTKRPDDRRNTGPAPRSGQPPVKGRPFNDRKGGGQFQRPRPEGGERRQPQHRPPQGGPPESGEAKREGGRRRGRRRWRGNRGGGGGRSEGGQQ